ncbi:MAG: TRAP transporter small permease [Acidobacteria bacterium]|nr:TRAP transporter small permease [Acidobacteriota bacterium]
MAGKRAARSFGLWIKRVNQGLVSFAGSLIVLMAFLATYGSVRRYAFNAPEPVSYEISKMFLLLSFVLAVAAVEMQNRFLRCDLLLERFPENIRNIISNILSPILGIIFFGIITWISFSDTLRAFRIDQHSQSSWPVPLFPIKLMIPAGYGFLCLVLLVRLIGGLLRLKTTPGEPKDNSY